MIVEMVTCDGPSCDISELMVSSLVPHSWVTHEGHHYCGPECVISHWGRA